MIAKKLMVVTEIFSLDGAKVFNKDLFKIKSSLNIDCKLHVVVVCATL